MNISTKQLPKSEILITVEIEPQELEKYEAEATKRISESVDIAGFRRGQAPKAFVIAQVGNDAFFQEVLNAALPRTYLEVIQKDNLHVISRPEIKIINKAPLKYEARVALSPEIKFKGYEKIKIAEKPAEITDKEIDEVVMEMRKYKAGYKPLDREIRHGDKVEIDFEGFDESGAVLPKTKSQNHPLFVGGGTLVKGFEDQLVGMKTGEKKKFPILFPKNYHHEPLKGKTVHFEVTIRRAEEAILPDIDEKFISEILGQQKTVDEFHETVKSDIRRRKAADIKRQRENELLEKFLEEAKFEISQLLIDEETEFMVDDLKRELSHRGVSFENYVKKLQEEKRDLRQEYAKEASKRISIRLILNYLFKEMDIQVSDDEMNAAISALLGQTPEEEREQLKKELESKRELYLRLKNNIMLEKLFQKFLG